MKATYSSETSVDLQRITQRYIPEDRIHERCSVVYLIFWFSVRLMLADMLKPGHILRFISPRESFLSTSSYACYAIVRILFLYVRDMHKL
jgi:hypothetical protein